MRKLGLGVRFGLGLDVGLGLGKPGEIRVLFGSCPKSANGKIHVAHVLLSLALFKADPRK